MTIRIAHFTDLHITAPPDQIDYKWLFGKRVIGWANLVLRDRYAAVQAATDVAKALVQDIKEINPDHIVVTGDFTSLALPSEFEMAYKILAPLFQSSGATLLPGNHDLYTSSVVRSRLYEKWFSAWTNSDLEAGSYLLNGCNDYPFPLVRFLGNDVILLCLRDARPTSLYDSSGKVPHEQVKALERILSSELVADKVIILALHYGLVDGDGKPDGFFHRLRNASVIKSLADRYHVSLVIHGHIHRRFVHKQGSLGGMAIANPGAIAFRGLSMAYHLYEIQQDYIELHSRQYNQEAGAFSSWSDAPGNGVIWRAKNPL